MNLNLLRAATLAALVPVAAQAHFLLPFADEVQIQRPGDVPVALIFWHPFANGYVMDLETPQAFYMIHNGQTTDLMDRLDAATFKGSENDAAAFRASFPVKRSGDYVLVTEPTPYFEASEDKYIQQLTKVVFNRNGLPTDWAEPPHRHSHHRRLEVALATVRAPVRAPRPAGRPKRCFARSNRANRLAPRYRRRRNCRHGAGGQETWKNFIRSGACRPTSSRK